MTYSTDFPTTQSPFQGTNPDLSSAFVTKIDGAATTLPMVTTKAVTVTLIDGTYSAASGGNVLSDGGATVTVRGVCWSTSPNPTTADNVQADATGGEGTFDVTMTGLVAGTIYYVRAYATNSVGTSYDENEITFSTYSPQR